MYIIHHFYGTHCLMYTTSHIFKLLTKTTTAQNKVALSWHKVRGLYFLAVVFVATILTCRPANIGYDVYNW